MHTLIKQSTFRLAVVWDGVAIGLDSEFRPFYRLKTDGCRQEKQGCALVLCCSFSKSRYRWHEKGSSLIDYGCLVGGCLIEGLRQRLWLNRR
jgi:hypothetical protein